MLFLSVSFLSCVCPISCLSFPVSVLSHVCPVTCLSCHVFDLFVFVLSVSVLSVSVLSVSVVSVSVPSVSVLSVSVLSVSVLNCACPVRVCPVNAHPFLRVLSQFISLTDLSPVSCHCVSCVVFPSSTDYCYGHITPLQSFILSTLYENRNNVVNVMTLVQPYELPGSMPSVLCFLAPTSHALMYRICYNTCSFFQLLLGILVHLFHRMNRREKQKTILETLTTLPRE